MMIRNDLTGHSFGRLTALRPTAGRKIGCVVWRCSCSCGAELDVPSAYLKSGQKRSCGCLVVVENKSRSKHGMSKTSVYQAWRSMKLRCFSPSDKGFHDYGARGISVCQEWLDSFEAFNSHIGPKPKGRFTIGRIENNRGYEPGNVRWETSKQQNRNRRNTVRYVIDGVDASLAEHAERRGLNLKSVRQRIRNGESPQHALSRPIRATAATGRKRTGS